ncbi:M6 family metalloprotease domain-containing protein, partial [Candidatus Sumerlaeota bacterium]|nr:M6 family metalloprotease domain-containing protein [Candidatus Sumerlaeota bacterium]
MRWVRFGTAALVVSCLLLHMQGRWAGRTTDLSGRQVLYQQQVAIEEMSQNASRKEAVVPESVDGPAPKKVVTKSESNHVTDNALAPTERLFVPQPSTSIQAFAVGRQSAIVSGLAARPSVSVPSHPFNGVASIAGMPLISNAPNTDLTKSVSGYPLVIGPNYNTQIPRPSSTQEQNFRRDRFVAPNRDQRHSPAWQGGRGRLERDDVVLEPVGNTGENQGTRAAAPQTVSNNQKVGTIGDMATTTAPLAASDGVPDIRIGPATLTFTEPSAAPQFVKQPVVASPEFFQYVQPKGAKFRARTFGDEFYHWMETEDGWTVDWNPATRRYEYLNVKSTGAFAFTGLVVGVDNPAAAKIPKQARETQAVVKQKMAAAIRANSVALSSDAPTRVPSFGTVKQLVILANFSDTSTRFTQNDFDNLYNTPGYNQNGAKGSVRDYYYEASYHNLIVQTVVTQWVTLPQIKAYYGADVSWRGSDIRPMEAVSDAIAALDATGFDFSPFDADHDGWIDMFSVIHQGQGQEAGGDADTIWSHAWFIPTVTVDGVKISAYHIEPELLGSDLTTIGVICHEMGHAFGLPDLYDQDYSSRGAGRWCLMAYGCWSDWGRRPSHFSSWSKMKLGWIAPTLLDSDQNGVAVPSLSLNAKAYKITSGMASNEY